MDEYRKRKISVSAVLILVLLLFQAAFFQKKPEPVGSDVEIVPVSTNKTTEKKPSGNDKKTESEKSTESEEDTDAKEIAEEIHDEDIILNELNGPEWIRDYCRIARKIHKECTGYEYVDVEYAYSLVCINDDDIPELFVDIEYNGGPYNEISLFSVKEGRAFPLFDNEDDLTIEWSMDDYLRLVELEELPFSRSWSYFSYLERTGYFGLGTFLLELEIPIMMRDIYMMMR